LRLFTFFLGTKNAQIPNNHRTRLHFLPKSEHEIAPKDVFLQLPEKMNAPWWRQAAIGGVCARMYNLNLKGDGVRLNRCILGEAADDSCTDQLGREPCRQTDEQESRRPTGRVGFFLEPK
jgi:hypothetical protein